MRPRAQTTAVGRRSRSTCRRVQPSADPAPSNRVADKRAHAATIETDEEWRLTYHARRPVRSQCFRSCSKGRCRRVADAVSVERCRICAVRAVLQPAGSSSNHWPYRRAEQSLSAARFLDSLPARRRRGRKRRAHDTLVTTRRSSVRSQAAADRLNTRLSATKQRRTTALRAATASATCAWCVCLCHQFSDVEARYAQRVHERTRCWPSAWRRRCYCRTDVMTKAANSGK